MQEEVYTASDPNWRETKKRRDKEEKIRAVKLWLHGKIWGFLFFIKLARPIQRFMCFTGTYPKYTKGGRCHYCGDVHGFWHFIKPVDYTQISGDLY